MSGYSITDVISGCPAGAAPIISTLAKRQERKSLRARYIIVVPHGGPAPETAVLYCAGHRMITDLSRIEPLPAMRCEKCGILTADHSESEYWGHGEGAQYHPVPKGYEIFGGGVLKADAVRVVDVYRGSANQLADVPGCIPAVDIQALPVSPAERDAVRRQWGDLGDADEHLDRLARVHRGDLSTIPYLLQSPWRLNQQQAKQAGTMTLATEHLYAGVRQEHERWQYYRGLGSHLVICGTADTREESEMMARAHLCRAWLDRVQEIRAARGGDLSWGWSVPSPFWREIGDPQSTY